jgi:hypothetical protein
MGIAWTIAPQDGGCRVELELAGRSGAIAPVTLSSDGSVLALRFAKPDLPSRAFLPIRVDRQRFSNLMLRTGDGVGELVLSEETVAALRKGSTLDIAWLADEPVGAPLAGSEQALADLRTCGAQAAAQQRSRVAEAQASRERAEAQARAKAVTDAQLAAARAQAAAAEAQRRRVEAEADRLRQAEAVERQRAAYAESERRRAYEESPRGLTYEDEEEDERWLPPPPRPLWPPQPRWPYPRD